MAKIRVYSAVNAFEAQIVRSALENAGIAVQMKNEMLSPLAGALPVSDVMAEVWIDAADEVAAAEVLKPILERQNGELSIRDGAIGGELSLDGEDRECPACKEISPAGFGECWSCQTPFDEAPTE